MRSGYMIIFLHEQLSCLTKTLSGPPFISKLRLAVLERNGSVAGAANDAYWSLQIEAIQMQFTDELAAVYEAHYRVHISGFGWLS